MPSDLTALSAAELLAEYTRAVLLGTDSPPLRAELLRRLRQWDGLAPAFRSHPPGPVDPPTRLPPHPRSPEQE